MCIRDSVYIDWLYNFASVWDFRKKQSNGGERWTIFDEPFVEENRDIIMSNVEQLGLIKKISPEFEPDYILPLGGARMSNLDRPNMAKYVMEKNDWKKKTIVALSGTRPLSEIEMPYIKTYSPSAKSEFEAICGGLERAFGLKPLYTEQIFAENNINSQACIRKYDEEYLDSCIYSIAAPSSEPDKRRANSYDTFVYFLEKFNIKEHDKLLLITSSIYVPFQLLKFMGLALECAIDVDCICADSVMKDLQLSKPSNYLQEIKSTIDAIYSLKQTYFNS